MSIMKNFFVAQMHGDVFVLQGSVARPQEESKLHRNHRVSDRSLLLLVAFLLVDAPNCHLSLVLASVVQGDAVNCNTTLLGHT